MKGGSNEADFSIELDASTRRTELPSFEPPPFEYLYAPYMSRTLL
jgi:hypothetical protein